MEVILIKDVKILKKFEEEFLKKEKLSYEKGLKIFENLWEEAVYLKILPDKPSLDSTEKDIRIAKILNLCSKK